MSSPEPTQVPAAVSAHYRAYAGKPGAPFGTGLINRTFLVESDAGDRAVFQRLHPVFGPTVNEDIDAVTQHLALKGLVTPRVLRTKDDALFVTDEDGTCWRALTYVDGVAVDRVDGPERARAAGAAVARFHEATSDLSWSYRHVRAGVHDSKKHLVALARAMAKHRTHKLSKDVEPTAQQILARGSTLPSFDALPLRHAHGDLKISNVLFDRNDANRALCLVDLDTLSRMALPHELGDALRSWCNPGGEDAVSATVDKDVFRAALEGYSSVKGATVAAAEADLLVDGLYAICVELAARFAADALNESYFGYDEKRFKSRGEHNLVRAQGQLALAAAVDGQRGALKTIVKETLG